jgi:hypothetical protein
MKHFFPVRWLAQKYLFCIGTSNLNQSLKASIALGSTECLLCTGTGDINKNMKTSTDTVLHWIIIEFLLCIKTGVLTRMWKLALH